MYGKLGSQLILQCPLQSISTFTWRGPPILRIYSSNGQVVSSKKNIVFVNRTNMGTETLTIKNYNKATAGLYQCETIVNGQATEHEIQVMTAGKYVRLRTAMAYVGSMITWKCDGNTLKCVCDHAELRWLEMIVDCQ